MMEFVDSHAHINTESFKHNWLDVVASANAAGVSTIINNAGDLASSEWGIEQSEKLLQLYTTVGIHPEFLLETDQAIDASYFNNLRRLIEQSQKVVAIGEIGLDYTLDDQKASLEKQRELFISQLHIALEYDLPITLHVRDLPGKSNCFNDMFSILQQYTTLNSSVTIPNFIAKAKSMPKLRGVFHCWTGTPDQLATALELDFYVSFSGILTYKSAGHILEAAKLVPLDKVLIETDAPYLTPEPARSKIKPSENLPQYVIMTAEKLASIKDIPLSTIAEVTSQNARNLFNLT